MRVLRIIRKFERFHFNGIPEQPEHTWERDGNSHIAMRQTGKPQSSQNNSEKNDDAVSIGSLTYNFDKDQAEFVYNNEIFE